MQGTPQPGRDQSTLVQFLLEEPLALLLLSLAVAKQLLRWTSNRAFFSCGTQGLMAQGPWQEGGGKHKADWPGPIRASPQTWCHTAVASSLFMSIGASYCPTFQRAMPELGLTEAAEDTPRLRVPRCLSARGTLSPR